MAWTWTRAVWIEGTEPTEGTIPTCWIVNGDLKWPKNNYKDAIGRKLLPSENWMSYPILKKKFTDGKYLLSKYYCTVMIKINYPVWYPNVLLFQVTRHYVKNITSQVHMKLMKKLFSQKVCIVIIPLR